MGAAAIIDNKLMPEIGGQTQAMLPGLAAALPHIKTGRMRALAVTGLHRHPQLKDVPTMDEAGVPDYQSTVWYAFAAPPKAKPEQVKRLNAAINEVLKDPAIVAQLTKMGMKASPGTSEQLVQYARRESDKWGQVIKQANIRASK